MERSSSAAGPRIYVPLCGVGVTDTSTTQPTYAVLEFVGFSSPANHPIPPPLHHPPLLHHHHHQQQQQQQQHHHSSSTMLCLPPPNLPSPNSSSTTSHQLVPSNSNTFFPLTIPSHFNLAAGAASPSPIPLYLPSPANYPPRREVVNLDSPPSSPSSRAPSSASSASRESKEKTSLSTTCSTSNNNNNNSMMISNNNSMMISNNNNNTKHQHQQQLASSTTSSNNGLQHRPLVSSTSDAHVMQTKISVSQTERETIVHTHSSNFRDVVRQLTGASSDDQDLLPVTLPARLANRVNNSSSTSTSTTSSAAPQAPAELNSVASNMNMNMNMNNIMNNNNNNNNNNRTASELGLRKAPLKLHERRKSSMKNLEKLTTVFHSEVSPFNPSPVTPLASDFEKFCNATTPTSQSSSALNSPIALINKAKSSIDPANPALNPSLNSPMGLVNMAKSSLDMGNSVLVVPVQEATIISTTASSSYRKPSPTLLSLFPESPVCSPRDR